MIGRTSIFLVGLAAFLAESAPLHAADSLTLEAYLAQAAERGPALAASRATLTGLALKPLEIDMQYSPIFNTSYSFVDDRKEATSVLSPERTRADQWSVNLSKKWFTGTTTTLGYGMNYAKLFFPPMPSAVSGFLPPEVSCDAKPSLTVSQSLLRDFMGGLTESGIQKIKKASSAGEKGEQYKAQAALFQAEQAYWQLALARKTVEFKKASLERTMKLREWTEKRVKLNLADPADLMQTDAGAKLRELDLRMAQESERAAARNFNTQRGSEGEAAEEALEDILVRADSLPQALEKKNERLDSQAAKEVLESARLAAKETFYKALPDLSVFGTIASNGHDLTFPAANDKSMQYKWPTYMVGAMFTSPLDFITLRKVQAGYDSDYEGAQAGYRRAQMEETRDWSNLRGNWEDAAVRLKLAGEIVSLQEARRTADQARYSNGRITTYQLLTTEEDYSQAQLNHLQMGFGKLLLNAQARMYNGGYSTASKGDNR